MTDDGCQMTENRKQMSDYRLQMTLLRLSGFAGQPDASLLHPKPNAPAERDDTYSL